MKKALRPFRSKGFLTVVSLLPLALGLIAYGYYYTDQNGIYDLSCSLFSSLRLYLAVVDIPVKDVLLLPLPVRLCLEGGRWIGLFVATTFASRLLSGVIRNLRVRWKAANPKAIAVHGQERFAALLRESIGKEAIVEDGESKFRAARHIVAFESDLELFRFLNEHFAQLAERKPGGTARRVYLCSAGTPRTNYLGMGFVISNMAENTARMYWNRLYLRRFGERPERRVVIVGFGDYGQQLLSQGLLVNVFLETPDLRYDVYGNPDPYLNGHRRLADMLSVDREAEGTDCVFFHREPWDLDPEPLQAADRILLADDSEEKNLRDLNRLMELNIHVPVHIRASDLRLVQCLWPHKKVAENTGDADICVFGTDRSLYTRAIVLEESLQLQARCIHAQYMRRVGRPACAGCPQPGTLLECARGCAAVEKEWAEMEPFFQSSNIAQADHLPVKARQLLGRDFAVTGECVNECRARYQELKEADRLIPYFAMEHNRWLRNQRLHGWVYGPQRDNRARIHPLMVPFASLPDHQQRKDSDAYEVMMDILESEKAGEKHV
jgi:hypothetical protein